MATGGGGLGVLGYIGLGKESSGGVAVPAQHFIRALSEGVSGEFDRYSPMAIIGALAPPDDRAGVMRVAGDITAPVNPLTAGHVFTNAFGADTTASLGAGLYSHLWKTPTNQQATWDDRYAIQPYTWEIFRDVGSAQQYDGCQVGGMEFVIAPNNILQMKASLIATAWRNIAAAQPSYNTAIDILDFDTASLSIGGVANAEIESLTVTFDNALEGIPTLWGRDVVRKIRRTGPPAVTLQLQMGFENISILEQFRQQSETNLSVYCKQPAATEAFRLDLPRIVYQTYPTGMGDGGRQVVTVTAQARYHQGSATAFGLTLINGQGSY
jgi:hypothetical protein